MILHSFKRPHSRRSYVCYHTKTRMYEQLKAHIHIYSCKKRIQLSGNVIIPCASPSWEVAFSFKAQTNINTNCFIFCKIYKRPLKYQYLPSNVLAIKYLFKLLIKIGICFQHTILKKYKIGSNWFLYKVCRIKICMSYHRKDTKLFQMITI